MDMRTWFKEAQYGMMAHWGLYSLLAGEYNGTYCSHSFSEWMQANQKIPNAEYENPSFGFSTIILSEFILPQTSQVSLNTGFFYCLKT